MRNFIVIGVYLFLHAFSIEVIAEGEEDLNATIWGYDTGWLMLKNAELLDVHLDDQVEDGCWTDLSGTRNAVELQLIRSGYETQDGEDGSIFIPDVSISAVGYEVAGVCAMALTLKASVPDFAEYAVGDGVLTSLYAKSVVSYGAVVTSGKSGSNSMMKNQFESMVQQFLVDVQRVKQIMRGELEEQEQDAGTEYWIEQLK